MKSPPKFAPLSPLSPQTPPADPLQRSCTAVAGGVHCPVQTHLSAPSAPSAPVADHGRGRRRLDAVARSERLAATGMRQAEADARAAETAGVSAVTLRRWRLACRDMPPEARLAALTDRPGRGRRGTMTDPAMRDCVEALIHEHGPHLTAPHVCRVLKARYGHAPSLRAVQRWFRNWRADAANARALSAVSDPDGHRSRRAPAMGSMTQAVIRLNQVWELDSTPADVMCADGRHAIVGAMDVWSRRGRLLVVPVSRATAICALLRRCLIDWGVPETVRTDRGKDYTSAHLARVLADLGVTHDICPPYTPEAKPFIERFLGTVTRDLFAFLPGFIGHNVAERRKLEARKSMAARRRRRRHDADERATFGVDLTAAELQTKCDRWCTLIYGRRVHRGLGESPWARAQSWTGETRRIADERALDPLLAAPVADGGRRTIGKNGISVGHVLYIEPTFGAHVGERVDVRLDASDPARLFVFRLTGEFLCVAEDPERTGIDRAAADARDAAEREAGKIIALPQRGGAALRTAALEQAAQAAKATETTEAAAAGRGAAGGPGGEPESSGARLATRAAQSPFRKALTHFIRHSSLSPSFPSSHTGFKGCGWQIPHRGQIGLQLFADTGLVTAQNIHTCRLRHGSSRYRLNASQSAKCGIGTMKLRRAYPTNPSTLPLSLPLPGRPDRSRIT